MFYVTVSKKWHNPKIYSYIDNEGIELSIPFDDFREAVKSEMKPITLVFRKATFDKLLDEAFQRALIGLKKESIKVI